MSSTRKKFKTKLTRERVRSAWLFMMPMFVALGIVAIYPLFNTIKYSFTDARLGDLYNYNYIGWFNYETLLFYDSWWWVSVYNTFFFSIVSVSLETVIGVIFALILNNNIPARGIVRAAILIPWAIPTIVNAKMFQWMFNQQFGVFNEILLDLHLISEPIAFLAYPDSAMASAIFVDVWKTTPFITLLTLAALQMIPAEIYESTRIDGVSPLRVFWKITLPLIKPTLVIAIIFRSLDALRVFDLLYVLTSNSRENASMSVYARQWLVDYMEVGQGSAASTLLFAFLTISTIIYLIVTRTNFDKQGVY